MNTLRQSYSYPWMFSYSENNGLDTPKKFIAGDSYDLKISNADYKASALWSFKLYIRGTSQLDLTASADPDNADNFVITITATQTAALVPGMYQFFGRFTKGNDAHSPEGYNVQIEVLKNIATVTAPLDVRTDARIMYDACVAAIKKLMTNPQIVVTLPTGATYQYTQLRDLWSMKKKLEWELRDEVNAERIAKGIGRPRILTRFQRTSG